MDDVRRAKAQRDAARVLASIERSKAYMLRADAEELVDGFKALLTSMWTAENRIDELTQPKDAYVQEGRRFELPDVVKGMSPYLVVDDVMDVRELKARLDLVSRCRIHPPLPCIAPRSVLRNPSVYTT